MIRDELPENYFKVATSIVPFLLKDVINKEIELDPELKLGLNEALQVIKRQNVICFEGINNPNVEEILKNRIEKVLTVLVNYMDKNKFCINKRYYACCLLGLALENQGAVEFTEEINDLFRCTKEALETAENTAKEDFDKICKSGAKHMPKLLKLAQQEGYF